MPPSAAVLPVTFLRRERVPGTQNLLSIAGGGPELLHSGRST
ncbi:MAG: hypothetical protein R3B91_20035 [Planctomycetaceae bacterium]